MRKHLVTSACVLITFVYRHLLTTCLHGKQLCRRVRVLIYHRLLKIIVTDLYTHLLHLVQKNYHHYLRHSKPLVHIVWDIAYMLKYISWLQQVTYSLQHTYVTTYKQPIKIVTVMILIRQVRNFTWCQKWLVTTNLCKPPEPLRLIGNNSRNSKNNYNGFWWALNQDWYYVVTRRKRRSRSPQDSAVGLERQWPKVRQNVRGIWEVLHSTEEYSIWMTWFLEDGESIDSYLTRDRLLWIW